MESTIVSFDKPEAQAIDLCHNIFAYGAALARKPYHILELGIGTGYVSNALLSAIKYNQRGDLICVDNWHDWGGTEPPIANILRYAGAQIIVSTEEQFVKSCNSNKFDFLVSDADHNNSGNWVKEHLRIAVNNAFMFFHDTNLVRYQSLYHIIDHIKHLPHYHFTEGSRTDEQCENGWLFVVNKK